MAKITEDQLEKVKDLNSKLNETVTRIGLLESNKHALLHEIAGVNKDLEEFKSELEKEYGSINIDMATGEYTEIEKEEDEGESAVVKAED
jgi:vacuolar-type H+-ATPase subunit D/Vma8